MKTFTFALISLSSLSTLALANANAYPYDILHCTSTLAVTLKNVAPAMTVTTTTFEVHQNGNRHYAQVIVNGQDLGTVSYQRSPGGRQISISSSSSNLKLFLKPVQGSAPIILSRAQTAYSAYESVRSSATVNVTCSYSNTQNP